MSSAIQEATLAPSSGHGLSLLTAALFIVGETAGTGVLALPAAVAGTGWLGIFIIVFCCFAAGFTGIFLGKSWILVEHLYPETQTGSKVKSLETVPQIFPIFPAEFSEISQLLEFFIHSPRFEIPIH